VVVWRAADTRSAYWPSYVAIIVIIVLVIITHKVRMTGWWAGWWLAIQQPRTSQQKSSGRPSGY
jgi:hypothetical protein